MKTLLDRDRLVFEPPQPGCVLYLPGLPGGGNKLYDRSPYANVGTITGATWKRLPSGLWYLDFDGTDDYLDVGQDSSLMPTTSLTIELWLNPDTIVGSHRLLVCRHSYFHYYGCS